ncbi:tetratricopeptide repeat protein [Nostoc cycadae]|uniref:tetratricopeptide repeat protein n=1 Tax=Nostoc cycadae TaxID=246795 RepID=UPI001FE3E0B8|nr:tetratricopeptide repeat protein [Nostoc cycadae]
MGRDEELEELHKLLQENNQVAIAAILGMGGLGKTELALQYAIRQRENYKGGLCWLRAREEDIGFQILKFAIAKLGLKPPEDPDVLKPVDFCWSHWHDGNVLVVLDDVNDYAKVKQYLPPQSPRFKVLITTRLQLDLPQSLHLPVFSEPAALELLQEWVGREKVAQELVDAKEICHRLGYLPLALNLVGRYVKKRKLTLAEMLRRLEAKKVSHESLARDEKDRTWTLNVERGVIDAFELSWDELSDNAKELAVLLSLFALAPIPWTLVESVETGKDAEQLEDSRVELEDLHVLQGEDSYQLHQLIREFFQLKQAEFNRVEEFKRSLSQVMVAVAKDIPYTPTLEQIKNFAPVIPHIAEVANNFIEYVSDDNVIMPFIGNAWFYSGQGLYDQAFPWCEECLKATIKRLGEEHIYVATSLYNLGGLYHSQGQCKEAEPLYQKALALRQHLQGEENLDVAQILNSLGLLYTYQRKYREAKSNCYKALIIRRHLLGKENLDVAQSFNNLGLLYASQRRYRKAEPLYQKALALRRHLLGEKHLDVAQSLNNLALLYKSQGEYYKAEPRYLEALEIQQDLLGKEHHTIATTLNNLAGLYDSQGRYSEAELLYSQALDIFERRLGANHPNTVNTRDNLANVRDYLS